MFTVFQALAEKPQKSTEKKNENARIGAFELNIEVSKCNCCGVLGYPDPLNSKLHEKLENKTTEFLIGKLFLFGSSGC